MLLYHGSHTHFEKINLDKCHRNKDFGQGFYLTNLEDQAIEWAREIARRNKKTIGYVSVYEFNLSDIKPYKYKKFDNPSDEWLDFIISNRDPERGPIGDGDNNLSLKYDVVEGPVANDKIGLSIDLYFEGLYSREALTDQLKWKKLNHQISFHTPEVTKLLRKVKHYEVTR